ncbi:MAG: protein kinase [Planctomycetes bacterium]|nr:protein kinase [Planctomycetota bacterium]
MPTDNVKTSDTLDANKPKTADTLDANKPKTADTLDANKTKPDDGKTLPVAGKSVPPSSAAKPSEEVKTVWAEALTYHTDPHKTIKHRREQPGKWANLPVALHLVAWDDKDADAKDDFQLCQVLGEGGMGIVYEARQTAMDRIIAVKMLKVDHAKKNQQRSKFLSEAVVTSNLEHPNIVPVYDIGVNEQGQLFYAMKKARGTPWNKALKDMTQGENIDVLMHVADAAAFAHSRGVIHRDLKPDNVMLGEFGEVLVMDWGMALSVAKGGKADELTRESAFGGTPAYMAPEMASGDPDRIGYHSDVYLLGGILYEILTAQKPHGGANINQTLEHALGNVIQPTKEAGELLDIAMKAMATNTDDRYQTVKDFQTAIRDCQSHSESISLVSHARRDLDRARITGSYEDFSSAVFGFREALEQWPFNERARQWLTQASLEYAGCAFDKGDLDLAISLLKDDEPSHAGLRERVALAKADKEKKQARLKFLGAAIYGLGLIIIILLVGSFLYIRSEKDQKYKAEEASRQALQRELGAREKQLQAEQNQWKSEDEKRRLTEKMASENRRIWRPVFEDDFSDARLDARWQRFGGNWQVSAGQLKTAGGKPAPIFLKKQYPGDIKIELDYRMDGDNQKHGFSVSMSAMPKPAFEDDFSDIWLDSRWQRFGSNWQIKDGQLRTAGDRTSVIFLKKPYPGDVKIEFGCRMEGGGRKSGFSVFLTTLPKLVDVNSNKPLSGYEFALAGSQLKIQKNGKECAAIFLPPTEIDKEYKVLVERRGNRLSVSVDDKSASWEDAEPLTASEIGVIGLAGHAPQTCWKNFRIYQWNPDKLISGYEFILADSQLKIQKYGKEYAGIVLPPSESGMEHKVVVERRGGRLSVSVDDKSVSWEDPNPLTGPDSAAIGLAGYADATRWDNLKIFELGPPIKADLLETAQRHLQMGHYITARDLFEEVVNSSDVPDRLEQAKLGLRDVNLNLEVKKKNVEKGPLLAGIYPGSKPVFTIRDGMIVLDMSNSDIWNLNTLVNARIQVDGLILDNNNIADLTPLAGMRLKMLSFNKCKVRDLSPLKGMPLESLSFSDNVVSLLEPLSGMKLTRLDCSNNKIKSLQPLAPRDAPPDDPRQAEMDRLLGVPRTQPAYPPEMAKYLERLNQASGVSNPVRAEGGWGKPDAAPQNPPEGMKLVSLKCDGNDITTLAPLQEMPLKKLSFARNQIRSMEPIKGMKLGMIHCWGNPIVDYSPLDALPEETEKDCPWVSYLLHRMTAEELLAVKLKDSNGELYYQVYIAARCEFEGDTAGAIKAYESAASSVDPYISAYAAWKLEELKSKTGK